jgi:hypothetical protein
MEREDVHILVVLLTLIAKISLRQSNVSKLFLSGLDFGHKLQQLSVIVSPGYLYKTCLHEARCSVPECIICMALMLD